eukprot:TRINITY_DN20000_c0_g1_i2.p2 TRINITY_DN20000_c0_g1~~TRINITY_DN20000_c0_g1_i2.p2  ORF type:complete len:112 (+),score=22.01 TRINITY_DN20000_c0_g1_i2:573-908(+)
MQNLMICRELLAKVSERHPIKAVGEIADKHADLVALLGKCAVSRLLGVFGWAVARKVASLAAAEALGIAAIRLPRLGAVPCDCLLYTSDAADEEDSVDLGGRRIIKKKTNE